jgi:hypothetical protein
VYTAREDLMITIEIEVSVNGGVVFRFTNPDDTVLIVASVTTLQAIQQELENAAVYIEQYIDDLRSSQASGEEL